MQWLLMNSPNYREKVAAVVRAAGFGTIDPPYSTDGGAADVVATELRPDVVVFDHNVSQFRFVEAGVYRGRGLPVVFVAGPSANAAADARKYARRLGFAVVESVDHFRSWLRSEPPYLMPPAFDADNGELPEACPTCRVQMREHWNGTCNVCPRCRGRVLVNGGVS